MLEEISQCFLFFFYFSEPQWELCYKLKYEKMSNLSLWKGYCEDLSVGVLPLTL